MRSELSSLSPEFDNLIVGLGVVIFGVTAYSAVVVLIGVGTLPNSEFFDGPATVTVRSLTIAPGEVLAWHYHPGRVFTVVKRGTLTLENGCGGEEIFTEGQAFEEHPGHIHRGKNLGADEVETIQTFVVPQGLPTTIQTPGNERLCRPPMDVKDCRNGGWMNFTHPRSFRNQGDCNQYVLTGK